MSDELYAAIDLGANSFHLVIMRRQDSQLVTVDGYREIVRLASGIHPDTHQLRPEARRRALRCLQDIRQRLALHSVQKVRVVGTSAFRAMRHNADFLSAAETALGLPIEIVSGEDEARLIYLGATWGLPQSHRLVVDIGGGSTEIIIGHGAETQMAISLDVGSASLSAAFFQANRINQNHLEKARSHVKHLLERQFKPEQLPNHPLLAVGSSGTAKSLSWVMRSLHLSNGDITLDGLSRIAPLLWQVQNIDQLSQVLNLNVRRTHVFPGGYVIMDEIFRTLNIERMTISARALREGMIVEMLQSA
ncbi:hypothetical protein ACFOSD_02000 [Salinispirillum marinum]|uniref:Ppx/GppA phosphatase N-terminal domain-containing protein n=2 Tax=Saccharospirillaceae TaxID=255527 RepID=A0ABV8BB30_9GAMM